MKPCSAYYSTHDFSQSCNEPIMESTRVIPFDDYFPLVHSILINNHIKKHIITSERAFQKGNYKTSCKHKKKFSTQEEANLFIIQSISEHRKTSKTLRSYYCNVCNKYHTTSKENIPFIRTRIHKKACNLFVYPNSTAIIQDLLTSDSIFITYKTRKDKYNNVIGIDNVKFYIGEGNSDEAILVKNSIAQGDNNSIVGKESLSLIVNSSHIVIPDSNYLNIHKFVVWLSRLSYNKKVSYAAVSNEGNEHGVVIVPSGKDSRSYVAQLLIINNVYKLRIIDVVKIEDSGDDKRFFTGDGVFSVNSDFFSKTHKNRHRAKLSL